MSTLAHRTLALAFSLVLTGSVGWSQTATLQGKITDGIGGAPIPGVDVTVMTVYEKTPKKAITNKDGVYTVSKLKKGSTVKAFFSLGGYKPHPTATQVLLAQATNKQDVQLFRDTQDAAYWGAFAAMLKNAIEASAANKNQYAILYEREWSLLGAAGFSPQAQTQAAQQLMRVAPQASESHSITAFASIDLDTVSKTQINFHNALIGNGQLERSPIPPDVATAIAVYEFNAQPGASGQNKFSQDFEGIWGASAARELKRRELFEPNKVWYMGNKPDKKILDGTIGPA